MGSYNCTHCQYHLWTKDNKGHYCQAGQHEIPSLNDWLKCKYFKVVER